MSRDNEKNTRKKSSDKRKHITLDVIEGNRLLFQPCSFMNDAFHPKRLFIFVRPAKDYFYCKDYESILIFSKKIYLLFLISKILSRVNFLKKF